MASWSAPANAVPGAPWIGYGKTNTYNGVKCFQVLANSLHWQTGYHTVDEDGLFGPDTYGAIRAFQDWAGLPQDGVVGPDTGSAILSATQDGDGNGCYSYLPSHN
ncbi:peptidoglycan-binding protein [Streptomyces sp. NPDC059851]|uniref:peptidoglycan-binding domain-containing protein n=1 Tax=Streptomyces sp. NPDC059851 TaxID=3346971 RepID=UPI003657C6E4